MRNMSNAPAHLWVRPKGFAMRNLTVTACLVVCALTGQAVRAAGDPARPAVTYEPAIMEDGFPVVVPTPPGCEPAKRVSRRGATSPVDLTGKLPVPDYLDALYDCADPRGVGLRDLYKPRNDWLERDANRYSEVLARGKFSWLVVPVQTQYFGFDRIERALMSAEIADAFAAQGEAPNTFLVARALG